MTAQWVSAGVWVWVWVTETLPVDGLALKVL